MSIFPWHYLGEKNKNNAQFYTYYVRHRGLHQRFTDCPNSVIGATAPQNSRRSKIASARGFVTCKGSRAQCTH